MAYSKKYFYMRLKEDFFDSEEMVLLEALPDGILYQNILMKMYCRSLKSDGRLMFNNVIPYNAEMLAKITRMQVGTVEKALDVFSQMGLIEILDNGAIYMMNIQNFIGESSSEGDRKRQYRNEIEAEKKRLEQLTDKCQDKCPPNVRHIRDKDILEINNIIGDTVSDNVQHEKAPSKRKFVKPTLEEVKAYCKERNNCINAERFIDYYESNGWKVGKNSMKDWKAAVRTWEKNGYSKDEKKDNTDLSEYNSVINKFLY